jgi:putative ABC transport system permease protein
VGVLADARVTSLESNPPYMVYLPYWWRSYPATSLLVKTAGDPAAMASAIRRAVHELDADVAIGDMQPLERLVDDSLAGRRYQTGLFVVFGVIALFIATVGVYAVTSYAVSRRRREMNIRTALGAPPAQVVRMILVQSGQPIAIGLGIGVVGAGAVGDMVASLLFGVRPRDPMVIAAITLLVGTTGIVAAALAARSGLSLDPAAALREE